MINCRRAKLSKNQRKYAMLFLPVLVLWPLMSFASLFVLDKTPSSIYVEIAEYGIIFTMVLLPILLFLMFLLGYKLSEWRNSPMWFYVMPLLPFVLLTVLIIIWD